MRCCVFVAAEKAVSTLGYSLHKAVADGDEEQVRKILDHGEYLKHLPDEQAFINWRNPSQGRIVETSRTV